MIGFFRNQLLQRSKYASTFAFNTFSTAKSKFSELDIKEINLNSLSQVMIDHINVKSDGNLKEYFQKNQNLAEKLQSNPEIDQLVLFQELQNYNQYLYKEYLRQFLKIRIWNKRTYDQHFSTIQILAAKILHENYILQNQNQELLEQIPSELVKQDIYKQLGIITTYQEDKSLLMERYQMITQFKQYYEGKIQFLDFINHIKIYNFVKWSTSLHVYTENKIVNYSMNTASVIFGGLESLIFSIELMIIILLFLMVFYFQFQDLISYSHQGVPICFSCRFRRYFLTNEENVKDFQFCNGCDGQIKQAQKKGQGVVKRLWNQFFTSS